MKNANFSKKLSFSINFLNKLSINFISDIIYYLTRSDPTKFDESYFEQGIANLPEELRGNPVTDVKSHSPIRISHPDPNQYNIMMQGPKGGVKFNPSGVLLYLRDCRIIFDNGVSRIFDGRIYSILPEKALTDMIYQSVFASGTTYVPTPYDINVVVSAAESMLKPIGIGFPDPSMAEPYEVGSIPLIAFENGILNVETGELLGFTPYVYLTSYVHAWYDPSVKDAPAKKILQGIIPSQETLDFLFEMCGFFFFDPTMYPPAIFNLYGPGQTGKSAIATMIMAILGNENVAELGLEQLTAKFTVAELEGKRLNICGETGDTSSRITKVNGELLKRLTDGGMILVEQKNKRPYYIQNTAKFLFCTNTVPDFGDNSSGLYRRLYVIPCRVRQDERAQIYQYLVDDASRSWVINQSLKAFRIFVANGRKFTISAQMGQELDQFKSQDSMLDFIGQVFGTTDPGVVANRIAEDDTLSYTVELYSVYCDYCKGAGSPPLSRKKFVERIRNEFNLRTKTVVYHPEYSSTASTRTKYVL